MKRVLVSLYLAGMKALKCIPFFEKLNKELLRYGIELNLLNLCDQKFQTKCIIKNIQNLPFQYNKNVMSGIEKFNGFFEIAVMHDTPRDVQNPDGVYNRLKDRFQLFCNWIDYINPNFVFLWHQFNGLHFLAEKILTKRSIPFGFAHLGCLPGTIVFERGGEMGESWVAREPQHFRSLPVNEEDLKRAEKYIDFVVSNKLDRKPLTEEGQIYSLVNRLRTECKQIIFYAGQYDQYAALVPYDENSIAFHSPNYSDTFDALVHLDKIANRNKWAVLFKPHPGDVQNIPRDLNLQNTYSISGANIFDCIYQSDVTVTILSSTSYLSRLHGRPTVMLGRHQISDKGCVYEVKERKYTEATISAAIENGYPQDMEEAWQIHIAQLLKYYLYPLTPEVLEITGREVNELTRDLIDLMY